MSEALATIDHAPTQELCTLYYRWAKGGSGQIITGNIMVDSRYLGEPRNMVIEDDRHLLELKRLAEAGIQGKAHLWAQLNHPGKQSPKLLSKEPVAPSAIPLAPGYDRFFAPPRELTEKEIEEIIEHFARASRICKKAGFTGVQIHGAHGYLVNQFLSPLHNQREYHGGDHYKIECVFSWKSIWSSGHKQAAPFPSESSSTQPISCGAGSLKRSRSRSFAAFVTDANPLQKRVGGVPEKKGPVMLAQVTGTCHFFSVHLISA
jgi:hypothetical protein